MNNEGRKASHGGHGGHGLAEYVLQCLQMFMILNSVVHPAVQPPGMITALPKQSAAMAVEVPQQLAPLHIDKVSSSKPLSAAARASWRLNSSASANMMRRLASNSSRDVLGR